MFTKYTSALYLILFFLLMGCTRSVEVVDDPTAVLTPLPTVTSAPATPTPQQTTFAPPPAYTLTASAGLPIDVVAQAQRVAGEGWQAQGSADLTLVLNDGTPIAEWVYALVAPFPTVVDGFSQADLRTRWQGGTAPFLLQPADGYVWGTIWGAGGTAVQTTQTLTTDLWEIEDSLGLLPFEQLTPKLKVLAVDGQSPLNATFDASTYPLMVRVGVVGDPAKVNLFLQDWGTVWQNRDPQKLTHVAMTGVTALVRATAYQMELQGVLYPAEVVAPLLQQVDIAHVSNEVSFSPTCPYPDPLGGTSFCARESYFELLAWLGVDVIELTGNHLNDLGRENLIHTLEMYQEAGWQTFGGGADLAGAQEPALFVHHGNRIAFVGCNEIGPTYAWATESLAGARPCTDAFYEQISDLKDAGYLVIATLQYHEYYHYAPTPVQIVDFERVAQAGATAVSGSQAHHAQGFSFGESGAFIHYGLGNLFFDQMQSLGTRQTFIDTYVIYDGQLLSVELWTGLIENYARPREMTEEERVAVLTAVFNASHFR